MPTLDPINGKDRVFGLGLNKTGTTTLGVCLRTLGYRHAPFAGKLLPAVKQGQLDEAFEFATAYESFEDWPWPLMYRELEERYPEARFILTTRSDSEAWYESLCLHAERTGPTPERSLVYGFDRPQGHAVEHKRFYEEHNQAVLAHFAGRPESLLHVCWDKGASWPQLCAFLGEDIPRQRFPRPGTEAADDAASNPGAEGGSDDTRTRADDPGSAVKRPARADSGDSAGASAT